MTRTVLQVVAPFAGTVVPLDELPDPVYAGGVVGPGVALLPDADAEPVVVRSPCDGLVHALMPHAVMVVGEAGRSVLGHLGVRAAALGHVESHTAVGSRVSTGDALLSWSARAARADGAEVASPVVALQAPRAGVLAVVESGERVEAGQPLLFWS